MENSTYFSFKIWMTLLIGILFSCIIIIISIIYYTEFEKALNQRVLLHLSSIQELKTIQIENFISAEWEKFSSEFSKEEALGQFLNQSSKPTVLEKFVNEIDSSGIYDITHLKQELAGRGLALLLVQIEEGRKFFKMCGTPQVEKILMERTGMGNSGETYLVGPDYRLRSSSRFFPDIDPYEIVAKTKGTVNALTGVNGQGIIKDYRNESVYSVYHRLDILGLSLVILTEIDEREIKKPLTQLKNKLAVICVIVLLLSLSVIMLLSKKITIPIKHMSAIMMSLSKGQYNVDIPLESKILEIKHMFLASHELVSFIQNAISFSSHVTDLEFTKSYSPKNEYDILGKSLFNMRERLIAYNKEVTNKEIESKQWLITGQENERRRLAQDLHDGLGPLLTSLKMRFQTLELNEKEKKEFRSLLDETISEVRRVSFNLMPAVLLDFGMGEAVSRLIKLIGTSHPIKIKYNDETNHIEPGSNIDIHIFLYRIVQELINNTLRHAKASTIILTITEFDHQISLFYKDNGMGFDPDKVKKGAGLNNIKDRVEILGGNLLIDTTDIGVSFEIEIPKNKPYDKDSHSG